MGLHQQKNEKPACGNQLMTRPFRFEQMPPPSPFKVKKVSAHKFKITASGNLKHSRTVFVPEEIRSANCCRFGTYARGFYGIWVGLKADQTSLIYSAKTGALLERRIDPLKDPVFQAKITAFMDGKHSPIFYAVVHEGGYKRQNSFYNFATGFLTSNCLPDGAIFRDKEIAEAAAKVLTRIRSRDENNILCPGRRPRPWRAISVERRKNRFKFLDKVRGRYEEYIPVFPRPRPLPKAGPTEDARH